MSDTVLHCPSCAAAIPLSALTAQLRAQAEGQLAEEHACQVRAAEERGRAQAEGQARQRAERQRLELDAQERHAREAQAEALRLRQRNLELEAAQGTLAEQIRLKLEAKMRADSESRTQALLSSALERVREENALELQFAKEQLAEQHTKLQHAEQAELELRRRAAALEQRGRGIDLEVARRLDEQKAALEQAVRASATEEQLLKVREKDKQIADMRVIIDDLKRKGDQSSPVLQGEVLEIDVRAILERLYPRDVIASVPRGIAGADLLQTVRNKLGQECGRIIWELKNTKSWQPAWLAKLRENQRTIGANLAVLVSSKVPDQIHGFAQTDAVWVANLTTWMALSAALRDQLIHVAHARNASQTKGEKMEELHRYLSGDQFRQKVLGVAEPMARMQSELAQERRAMHRKWKEREKYIEQAMLSLAGMYGEMSGILGGALPGIPALELTPALADPAERESDT